MVYEQSFALDGMALGQALHDMWQEVCMALWDELLHLSWVQVLGAEVWNKEPRQPELKALEQLFV